MDAVTLGNDERSTIGSSAVTSLIGLDFVELSSERGDILAFAFGAIFVSAICAGLVLTLVAVDSFGVFFVLLVAVE